MKVTLIAATLALGAPVALAQSTTPQAPAPAMGGAGTPTAGMSATASQMRASTLIDRDVYSADNVEIGDLQDLILDNHGRVIAVVIQLENRLGFTERYVSLPFAQIQHGDRRVTLPMTREQIRTLPGYPYRE